MQNWIRLGSEVYAANYAENGFVKIKDHTFLGPVAQVNDGVFGGSALRFAGIEGTAPAENGLTEGWLGFADSEFPEVKLTTVLQASEGHARMRHVFQGDSSLIGGESLTLTALMLKAAPKLYAYEDGEIMPVPAEEGLLSCRTLVAETEDGVVLVDGGEFFAIAEDEDGFTLATGMHLEADVDLTKDGPFSTDWVEIIMGDSIQTVTAALE